MRSEATVRPLNVLVATPGGGGGQGGIDRIMAALKAELGNRSGATIRARFLATRGSGHIALAPFSLIRFCTDMVVSRLFGRVDLIHINLASYGSTYRKLIIANWARLLQIPYVIHLHGAEYRSFWTSADANLNRRICRMFERASRVIVLGSPWREFVAERAPETSARVVIVPNAVAQPKLQHRGGGESVHILFLGRIEARKGVPDLIGALVRMRDVPGWRATIAGDGAVPELRTQIMDLGLDDKVTIPGWLGPDETAELLATGDILTLPSLAENLPMSVIEAMACGLAVVVTPVGAVEDIVTDGQTGLLVPPRDEKRLAMALTKLVADAALRARLGAAAQAFQRVHLSIHPYADKICSVWVDAVFDARSREPEQRNAPYVGAGSRRQ